MKKPTKKQMRVAGNVALVLILVTVGVIGTLKYQQFIGNVKAEGVREYQVVKCDRYHDDDADIDWLQCDV